MDSRCWNPIVSYFTYTLIFMCQKLKTESCIAILDCLSLGRYLSPVYLTAIKSTPLYHMIFVELKYELPTLRSFS